MRRRALMALIGGAAISLSFPVGAQVPKKAYRIGFLWDNPGAFAEATAAFHDGLRQLGWIEGQNITIEYRWSEGSPQRLREFAEELAQQKVDLIVAPASINTEAAKRATPSIPIVFLTHADPIGTGHVTSLARPGGNITGLAVMMPETMRKGLELLKEAVPRLSRVGIVWNPATPSHKPGLEAVVTAATRLGVYPLPVAVHGAPEFDGAFATMASEHADGAAVLLTPLFATWAKRLAQLAVDHELPLMSAAREFALAGGLLTYGPVRADLFRRGASFVDRILKGAKPSDLPVEQPTKFELIINLKTAAALGLTIPRSILIRADEVIE